jgi:hypothetical protein
VNESDPKLLDLRPVLAEVQRLREENIRHNVFRTLLKSAGIKPSRGRWPRIHELRQHADSPIIPTVA